MRNTLSLTQLDTRSEPTIVFCMTPRQRLLDMQLPGGIDIYVSSRRASDQSWDEIAAAINRQLPNEPSLNGNTLRRWYQTREVAA